jgi:hypothetical protein
MIDQFVTQTARDLVLQALDLWIDELDHLA